MAGKRRAGLDRQHEVAHKHPPARSQDAGHAAHQPAANDRSEGAVKESLAVPHAASLLEHSSLGMRGNGPVRTALIQQMQHTHGNRALQRYLHAQRKDPKTPPPAPSIGWTGADKDTPNAGDTMQGANKTIHRIPLENLPGGNRDDATTTTAEGSAKGRAIVLLPNSISNSKATPLKVQVLLHLHGHGVGYRKRKTQLTNVANSTEGTAIAGGEPDTVRDVDLDHTSEQLEASGRPMIGVLPQGGTRSEFGGLNSDAYILAVFAALRSLGKLPEAAEPGGVVWSGHSGGGDAIANTLDSDREPKNLSELILFDAINVENKKGHEVGIYLEWLKGRIHKDIVKLKSETSGNEQGEAKDEKQATWLHENGFRFRAYTSGARTKAGNGADPNSYGGRYTMLQTQLESWLASSKEVKALGSKAQAVLRDNYVNFKYQAAAQHERLMGDSNGFKESLDALPSGTAGAASSGASTPAPQPALSRKAASSAAPAPVQKTQGQGATASATPVTLPVQRDDHDGHSADTTGTGDAPKFPKKRITMSDDNITLVPAKEPKDGKAGQAAVEESPAHFTDAIINHATSKTGSAWYGNFTEITFFGRALPAIHVELAKHLKERESALVRQFTAKPENSAKYGGKEGDAATIEAAGDDLGLSKKSGDYSGGRGTQTSSASISMHMFGLAVDLNYTANPWISQGDAALNVTNEVFGRIGLLVRNEKIVYSHGLTYDKIAALDKDVETYFSYLTDEAALQTRLDAAEKAPWKKLTIKKAKNLIEKDLKTLQGNWARSDTEEKKDSVKKGFMDFKKELVEGLDLDWGGSTYGDMMHFDMRNKGVGKDIYDSITWYKRQKLQESQKKYADEHKAPAAGTTGTQPAQPTGASVQRTLAPEVIRPSVTEAPIRTAQPSREPLTQPAQRAEHMQDTGDRRVAPLQRQAALTLQLGGGRGGTRTAPPPPSYFADATGHISAADGTVIGQTVGAQAYVRVDSSGKLGASVDKAAIATISTGGSVVRVRKVKVEDIPAAAGAGGTGSAAAANKEVKLTPEGNAVGVEVDYAGTFTGVVLKPSQGSTKSRGISWEPVDLADWPAGSQSKLKGVIEPQVALTEGFTWVLMDYAAKDGEASALHWVHSKHSKAEYEGSKTAIEDETKKLPANLQAEVQKNLKIISTVSTVEGPFGAQSGPGDSSASVGIFQWAQDAGSTSAGGSSLAVFFSGLKRRRDAALAIDEKKRTDEQKMYIEAWQQCEAVGLDVDSKGMITLTQGKNTHNATGSELEGVLSGTSGPMATGALSKYQLIAANDWINDIKSKIVRPGYPAEAAGLMDAKYSENGPGSTITLSLDTSAANYTLEMTSPSDHTTIDEMLADEKAVSVAVSIGVNRPHFVETAMWLALSSDDPKAEIDRLVEQITNAMAPTAGKGRRRTPRVDIDAAQIAKQSQEVQQAYAMLRRLLWPARAVLGAADEAKLEAKFQSKALSLYGEGSRKARATRLAVDSLAY